MALRDLAKRWIPPAVVDLIRAARRPQGPSEWEYCPQGWRAADPSPQGWNDESILQAQQRTWPDFVRLTSGNGLLGINHTDLLPNVANVGAHNTIMAFGYALALAAGGKPTVSLLDWGGGIGHYGVLAQTLVPRTRVAYYCKDVPILCAGGRDAFPEGTFFERDEECVGRTYDLVLASGSLHYSEDWPATVRLLSEVTNTYLYITRLPVVQRVPSYVVAQRPHTCGYHTEYQGWFLNRDEFLGCAGELGLQLVREILIDERPPVPGAPEQAEYRGFLFSPRGGCAAPQS